MARQKKEAVPSSSEKASTSKILDTSDYTTEMPKKSSGAGRTRNYAKLVYPSKEAYEEWYQRNRYDQDGNEIPHYDGADGYGDAPDNWLEILDDCHVPALISPLHAMDRNPDGTLKKPHYHVLLMFDGVKTREQADRIFDQIHGVGREEIQSVRGYARYLTHLDNPEKYQYKEPVRCLGGADYDAITYLPGDDLVNVMDMMEYIRANNIQSFAAFCDICKKNNPEWFKVIVLHRMAYIIKEYIKSVHWENQQMINEMNDRR